MAHLVRLRRTKLQEEAAARGMPSHSKQADAIGVHVSIHNRVMNGKTQELSGPYIVGILLAFGTDCVREQLHQFLDIEIDDREPVAS